MIGTVETEMTAFLEEKFSISRSEATRRMYKSVLGSFRSCLQAQKLDLLPPPDITDVQKATYMSDISSCAGRFLSSLSDSNRQSRTSILNSFYDRLDIPNPIILVKKARQQRKKCIQVTKEKVFETIQTINKSTGVGVRDTALILVSLDTGMIVADLRTVTTYEVYVNSDKTITIRGHKLLKGTSKALSRWIVHLYGNEWNSSEKPIWVSYAPSKKMQNAQMTAQGIAGVLKARLGTTSPCLCKTELEEIEKVCTF
jgi:site-specific recombinase XerD